MVSPRYGDGTHSHTRAVAPLSLRAEVAAYQDARMRAQNATTTRLRIYERRYRCRVDKLTSQERAVLAGIRDELRDRGEEVADL